MTRLPAGRFPQQLVDRRTSQAYDLDLSEAVCPRCGFSLTDPACLERIPSPHSWNATTKAWCADCGYVYMVRLDVVDDQPAQAGIPLQQSTVPPGASWFGSMRRR